MFMENCPAEQLDPTELPQKPVIFVAENNEHLYCWPWTGIIANITDHTWSERNTRDWFEDLPKYKPVKVEIGFGDQNHTEKSVVEFEGSWNGFRNAMEFEWSFESDGCGKNEWNERKSNPGLGVYGWLASADDYHMEGPLGEYIRSRTSLKSLCDVINDKTNDKKIDAVNLVSDNEMTVEIPNDSLPDLIDETKSLTWALEESRRMHEEFMEEKRRSERFEQELLCGLEMGSTLAAAQCIGDLSKKVCAIEPERQKLKDEENCIGDLRKKVCAIEPESQKLKDEENVNNQDCCKQIPNGDRESSRPEALLEQKLKAKENILRLVKQHKRDFEEEIIWYLQLEKQMVEQHALEMEIAVLKGKLQVMKHLDLGDDAAVKENMEDIATQLREKRSALADINSLEQDLIATEWEAHVELKAAREALIEEFEDHSSATEANVGIKRMGAIEPAAFIAACKKKFNADEAEAMATELTEIWQLRLEDPDWYPFKALEANGDAVGIIHEEDEVLNDLREEWGDGVHKAIIIALFDLNDYNPIGRKPVKELWNFKEGRRATMKEVIIQIWKDMKTV